MKISRLSALSGVVLLVLLLTGGTLAVAEVNRKIPDPAPQSLSGSVIAFDPNGGGEPCYAPGASQTFCFWAESYTEDWSFAQDQFLRFPEDWQVHNAYDAGPTLCDGGGEFQPFGWTHYNQNPFEIQIDHDRWHANPSDHCYTYVCVYATTGTSGGDAPVSWYWDGDGYGEPPYHPCSDDGYTPAGLAECDQMIYPPATIPACELPLWEKWVDDVPWEVGQSVTVETLDTVSVVDNVYTLEAFTLYEEWNPGELALLSVIVYPEDAGELVKGEDHIVLDVPPGEPASVSVTKIFQVLPCTWTGTELLERLYVRGELIEERPVTIQKRAQDLGLGGAWKPEVQAGQMASYSLHYSNFGGYENDTGIRSEFPPEAPFASSTPTADRVGPSGLWAEWDLGDLAELDFGNVAVYVDVQPGLPNATQLEFHNALLDHTGTAKAQLTVTLEITGTPPLWEKRVDDEGWTEGMSVTLKPHDTFEVVDVVNSLEPFRLETSWDGTKLTLLEAAITPEGAGTVEEGPGYLVVQVPADGTVAAEALAREPQAVEVATRFQVEPGEPPTWTKTELLKKLHLDAELWAERSLLIARSNEHRIFLPLTVRQSPPSPDRALRPGAAVRAAPNPAYGLGKKPQ